jgi:hypothetical protein
LNLKRPSSLNKHEFFHQENNKDEYSGSCVIFRVGTAQKVLRYLRVAEKPMSYREIGSAIKTPDFEETITDLLKQDLIIEVTSKNDKHFIITLRGRSKAIPTFFVETKEECP